MNDLPAWTLPAGTWILLNGVHYRLYHDTAVHGGIGPEQAAEEYKKYPPEEQSRIDKGLQVLLLIGSADAMIKKYSHGVTLQPCAEGK